MTRALFTVALLALTACKATESSTTNSETNKKTLSVESIFGGKSLSGNLPQNVKWSPDGQLVSFLKGSASDEKILDLWAYDLRTGKSSLLVAATQLLPEEDQKVSKEEEARRERARITSKGIVDYVWSPKSHYLLFPLGGDLFLFDLSQSKSTQLTKTEQPELDPKFSKDENQVSFIRENEIYTIELQSGKETRWTHDATEQIWNGVAEHVAQEEMDRMTAYWWSPDSQQIAFTQVDHKNVPKFHTPDYSDNRVAWETQFYPKAGDENVLVKLGVINLSTQQTSWVDLGKETDIYLARVDWLPDSKQLSYQIENRHQNRLDLYIADLSTGKTRLRHREEETEWVSLHDDLHFYDEGKRFTWSSERSGWKHLYSGKVDSSSDSENILQAITRGDWDMKKILEIDEKAGLAYFIGSEKSSLENHLYQVRLDGKNLKRITQGEGWHDIVLAPDSQSYLDTFSTPTKPRSLSIHKIDGSLLSTLTENKNSPFETFGLRAPEYLQFKSSEGLQFNAKLIKPANFDPNRKYPVLVFVYGGPESQLVKKSWGGDRDLWHYFLAEKGILVFTVDGRGTGFRGKAWSRPVFKNLGDLEVRDQVAGAKYLKSLPYVDPNRIGIWGWSYGGYMSSMAMFTAPETFKIGIAVAPVTTWANYDTHYAEHYMGLPKENPEGYKQSAPLTHVANLKGKFLLVHGTADDNVHFQDSVWMIEALQKAKRPFELMIYPGKRHGISGKDVQVHLYEMMTEFVLKNL